MAFLSPSAQLVGTHGLMVSWEGRSVMSSLSPSDIKILSRNKDKLKNAEEQSRLSYDRLNILSVLKKLEE